MADLTVSSPVDSFLQSADAAAMRAALGVALAGLPVWTFQASDGGNPATGKFTTDNAVPSSTSTINISQFQKQNGTASLLGSLGSIPAGAILVLTNSAGHSILLTLTASSNGASWAIFTVNFCTNAEPWSGDYQLSVWSGTPLVQSVNGRTGGVVVNVDDVETASSITPIADNNYNGRITTVKGIVTASNNVTPIANGDYAISNTLGGTVSIVDGLITAWTPAG